MNPVARLAQLFSRWIAFGLFWVAGILTGETLTAETTNSLNDFSTAIGTGIAALVVFLVDLWLHRLQKEKRS